jgi:hypothetical protein
VVCSMLNAAGIPAILADRNTIGMLWHQALAFGGFRILIHSDDLRQAKLMLADFRTAEPLEKLPESSAFWRQPLRNSLWLIINYLFGWCPAWLRKRKS